MDMHFKSIWTQENTTDDPEKIGTGAVKYDKGKAGAHRGLLSYFPRALMAVAEVSTFGASKYAWNGWRDVEDGEARYADAFVRHQLADAKGELLDPDSGLLHKAHRAWGDLAELELYLERMERERAWAKVNKTKEAATSQEQVREGIVGG